MSFFVDSKDEVRTLVRIKLMDFNIGVDAVIDVDDNDLFSGGPLPYVQKQDKIIVMASAPHNIWVKTSPGNVVKEYKVDWYEIANAKGQCTEAFLV